MMPSIDTEAEAIKNASNALAALPAEAQLRILRYLARRAEGKKGEEELNVPSQPELSFEQMCAEPEGVSDRLMHLYSREGENLSKSNQILIATAFIQAEKNNRAVFVSEIRTALTAAGVQMKNPSAFLESIMNRKTRRQLNFTLDKSNQKQFKVTTVGLKLVEKLTGEKLVVPKKKDVDPKGN